MHAGDGHHARSPSSTGSTPWPFEPAREMLFRYTDRKVVRTQTLLKPERHKYAAQASDMWAHAAAKEQSTLGCEVSSRYKAKKKGMQIFTRSQVLKQIAKKKGLSHWPVPSPSRPGYRQSSNVPSQMPGQEKFRSALSHVLSRDQSGPDGHATTNLALMNECDGSLTNPGAIVPYDMSAQQQVVDADEGPDD